MLSMNHLMTYFYQIKHMCSTFWTIILTRNPSTCLLKKYQPWHPQRYNFFRKKLPKSVQKQKEDFRKTKILSSKIWELCSQSTYCKPAMSKLANVNLQFFCENRDSCQIKPLFAWKFFLISFAVMRFSCNFTYNFAF